MVGLRWRTLYPFASHFFTLSSGHKIHDVDEGSNWRTLYPFASHFFTLPSGHKIHYVDEGPKESKEVVLCLHGNPTWSFFYRDIIKSLRPNYRVIALDHLGCGLSDRFSEKSYRLSQHIDNLERLVESLQLKSLTLVMHDWGGAIGMGWATKHPAMVKRLVFMNTAAFLDSDIPKRIAFLRTPFLGAFAIKYLNLFCVPALSMASTTGLAAEVRQGYLFPYQKASQRGAVSAFVADIPLRSSHPSYPTLQAIEKRLSSLQRPTLCLWGGARFLFPPRLS